MAKVAFASRRQAAGFACTLLGGLGALLFIGLPLLLSISTWPPWGDFALDADGVVVHATPTGQRRTFEGRKKGPDISWVLQVRFEDGPHADRTAWVFCTEEWPCASRAGALLEVEVSKGDASLARFPGRRFSALPFGVWATLVCLGVVSAVVLCVGVRLSATGGPR